MKSTNIEINQTKQEQQTLNTDAQKVSIDDIRVVAMGEPANTLEYDAGGPLECDAGGPYVWEWFMQFLYTPPGVRFHGSVQNETNFTTLTWDFGDGTIITGGLNNLYPFHFYNQTGIYNITLTAIDNLTTLP